MAPNLAHLAHHKVVVASVERKAPDCYSDQRCDGVVRWPGDGPADKEHGREPAHDGAQSRPFFMEPVGRVFQGTEASGVIDDERKADDGGCNRQEEELPNGGWVFGACQSECLDHSTQHEHCGRDEFEHGFSPLLWCENAPKTIPILYTNQEKSQVFGCLKKKAREKA